LIFLDKVFLEEAKMKNWLTLSNRVKDFFTYLGCVKMRECFISWFF